MAAGSADRAPVGAGPSRPSRPGRYAMILLWNGQALPDDMMAVTVTCETARWLSNDMLSVTGQRSYSDTIDHSRLSWYCDMLS